MVLIEPLLIPTSRAAGLTLVIKLVANIITMKMNGPMLGHLISTTGMREPYHINLSQLAHLALVLDGLSGRYMLRWQAKLLD